MQSWMHEIIQWQWHTFLPTIQALLVLLGKVQGTYVPSFPQHKSQYLCENVHISFSVLSDVQVYHQSLSSAFDLLLMFFPSLIQTLTLTPPPNNQLLVNMDVWSKMSLIHNHFTHLLQPGVCRQWCLTVSSLTINRLITITQGLWQLQENIFQLIILQSHS